MEKLIDQTITSDPLYDEDSQSIIDDILEENKTLPGATMVVLNGIQDKIGFISPAMQVYVAKKLGVPVSRVHGVVSFYSFFTTTPRGKHTIKFCIGTACYVGGIDQIIEKAKQTGALVTAEEHVLEGGLGSAICQVVCEHFPVPVELVGIRNRFGQSGTPEELFAEYKLTAKDIVEASTRAVKRKK